MNKPKYGVIISPRNTPSLQLANILENHGWQSTLLHTRQSFDHIQPLNPAILVVDIDEPNFRGIEMLKWFNKFNPLAYSAGLCRGSNYPAMQQARELGIDGFFYLNRSGTVLDITRGLAGFFSVSIPDGNRSHHATPHVTQMSYA